MAHRDPPDEETAEGVADECDQPSKTPHREAFGQAEDPTAREHQVETFADRGAEIYVGNCRNCHGLEGLGGEEGAIAPALNSSAYLILGEDNEYDVEETPVGVAQGIRTFLGDSIACGRKGTAMPVWSVGRRDEKSPPLKARRVLSRRLGSMVSDVSVGMVVPS